MNSRLMFDARVVDASKRFGSSRVARCEPSDFCVLGDLLFHPQALNSQSNEQHQRTVLLRSFHLNGHT